VCEKGVGSTNVQDATNDGVDDAVAVETLVDNDPVFSFVAVTTSALSAVEHLPATEGGGPGGSTSGEASKIFQVSSVRLK
jgi:hypothetical protein